jgi:hypothetical protein
MGIRYFDLPVYDRIDKHLYSKSPFTFTHGLFGDLVLIVSKKSMNF